MSDALTVSDCTALHALFEEHRGRVYRTCLAILKNPDDAEEATQEVFGRTLAWGGRPRDPGGWLQSVARHYCLDQLRQRHARWRADARTDRERHAVADPESQALMRHALRTAFQKLTERERRALARVIVLDQSLRSVAEDLGISYAAAAKLVSRARRRAAIGAATVVSARGLLIGRLGGGRERLRVPTMPAVRGPHLVAAVSTAVVLGAPGPHPSPQVALSPGVVQAAPPPAMSAPQAPPVSLPFVSASSRTLGPAAAVVMRAAVTVPKGPTTALAPPSAPPTPQQSPPPPAPACQQTGAHVGAGDGGAHAEISVCGT